MDSLDHIIVVGSSNYGGNTTMTVWRFLGFDGAPDTTFGPSARTYAVPADTFTSSSGSAVMVDASSKLLIAGTANVPPVPAIPSSRPAVWRYNPPFVGFDTWSTSVYGMTGASTTGNSVIPQAMAVDGGGKYIIAGVDLGTSGSVPNYMTIWRFNPGPVYPDHFETFSAPAATFISDTLGAAGGAFARGVAVDSSGRYVVSGRTYPNLSDLTSIDGLIVARYLTTGALDSTFGTGGVATFAPTVIGNRVGNRLTLDTDGKILVAGRAMFGSESGTRSVLARYKTNGTLDDTFNGGYFSSFTDTATINHGGTQAIVHPTNNKIYLLGQRNFPLSGLGGATQLVLYRVNP